MNRTRKPARVQQVMVAAVVLLALSWYSLSIYGAAGARWVASLPAQIVAVLPAGGASADVPNPLYPPGPN